MNSCYLFLDDSILNCAILDVIEKRSNRMYQLIAFDINGTLLTSKKQLQKAALKQLRELKMLVNKLYFQQDVLCQK